MSKPRKDKVVPQASNPSFAFPRIKMSRADKVWLRSVYSKFLVGQKTDPEEMLVELWGKIPEDFDCRTIDIRLLRNGNEITLLGILHIDPKTTFVGMMDHVIRFIQRSIRRTPSITDVAAEEISKNLRIDEKHVEVVLRLLCDFQDFWHGASGGNGLGYKSIGIRSENVKRAYLRYKDLNEPLTTFFELYAPERLERSLGLRSSLQLASLYDDLSDIASPQVIERDIVFMRLALEQAKKCRPEDDRSHPLVGVVVVKDDSVLATAFRGEVDPGDHAEFVALEKKLNSEVLAGATVYSTLEPCTTRNHPKMPCAERLIRRKISRVVVGMLDPNQSITGKGVSRLREANIATDFFPSILMAEAEEINRDFIKSQEGRVVFGAVTRGSAEMTELMETLCLKAEKNIRLLTHALGVEYELPESFAHSIAAHIKRREEAGKPLRFWPIIVVDSTIRAEAFQRAMARRDSIYAEHGVSQFMSTRYLPTNSPLSIGVLIIDNTHALLSLTTASASKQAQISVTFEQHQRLITELTDWFDQIVATQTVSASDFRVSLMDPSDVF